MRSLNMKPLYLGLVIAGLLAACDKGDKTGQAAVEPAPSQTEAAVSVPAKKPAPVPAPEGQKGADLLTSAGIKMDFPHAINYDIMDVSNAGTPRRRVLVEVLSGDFATATKQFGQSLTDAGYTKTKDTDKAGRIEQVYEQAGKPAYYLLMQPAGMGPKLLGKDAVGSIHIMWNVS